MELILLLISYGELADFPLEGHNDGAARVSNVKAGAKRSTP
ncbi:MAG TPA: hypothetical protein VMT52_19695 [Planctomycetota bacterium]|nr:hypothetical protein [Planctomycetota bacterium]